jgi:hypothetical protein
VTAGTDPQPDAAEPSNDHGPADPAAGWRVLCVSVRGHRYLVGSPTVHPIDEVPAQVGQRFTSHADVERYARHHLRGISALQQVEVIDDDGVTVRRGTRSGRNGTGERWTWQQV